jgi:hypothetical protein
MMMMMMMMMSFQDMRIRSLVCTFIYFIFIFPSFASIRLHVYFNVPHFSLNSLTEEKEETFL